MLGKNSIIAYPVRPIFRQRALQSFSYLLRIIHCCQLFFQKADNPLFNEFIELGKLLGRPVGKLNLPSHYLAI